MPVLRDSVFALYHGTGLGSIESPWISTALVFLVLATALYGVARLGVSWRARYRHKRTLYAATAWFAVLLAVTLLALCTYVAHFGKLSSNLANDTAFNVYWWVLFALANVPMYAVYWRAGELKHADI